MNPLPPFGNCFYGDPHPPHVWVGRVADLGNGITQTYYEPQTFACAGMDPK